MKTTETQGPSPRTVVAGRIVTGLTVFLLLLILLTGYFGGAVASHLRSQDPLWTHVFSPIYMGALVWVGIVLRDNRLRALIPWRRRPAMV